MKSEQHSKRLRHHNDSVAEVGKIDHEQWEGSQSGKQELVSPPKVQHIISKTEEDHAADGQQCTYQLYKLRENNTGIRVQLWSCEEHWCRHKSVPAHLIMWESFALISHKAAEERHWDEAEEDDEENSPTDDTLRFWATKREQM